MEETFLVNLQNNLEQHNDIQKIATGQGDDYTIGFLSDIFISKNSMN